MGCEWAKAARKDSAYRSGRSRDWLKMKNADARELARSVEELRALGEVSRAVNSTLDLETVLSTIVAKAVQLPNTDAGAIYVFDELDQTLRVRATYGLSDELVAAIRSQPAGASDALRRAIQDRQPLASPPSETPRDLADFQSRHGEAPRFAGKGREIAPGLRRDGTIRRSFSRTVAGKLAGVERWIRTPWQGE
jgi:transcriptional regulator with GAF, ATPase, and Fis domain